MKAIKVAAGIGTAVMALVGAFYSIAILEFLIETVKESENGDERQKANEDLKPLVVRTWRRKYAEIPPRNKEERRYGFR